MKKSILLCACVVLLSCSSKPDENILKKEIITTEKSFEKMCADSGISKAFVAFADSNAVILRGNDSVISGKDAIRHFYQNEKYQNATVTWAPDEVNVSEDGSMAWTYGKYCWKVIQEDGSQKVFNGVFHTVWKKQNNGSWKYVWD